MCLFDLSDVPDVMIHLVCLDCMFHGWICLFDVPDAPDSQMSLYGVSVLFVLWLDMS